MPGEWKEWQYQFSVATHAYNVNNGVLLEIVERMELDEINKRSVRDVQHAESVHQRRGQPVGEELRRQGWLCSVEEAAREIQSKDAGEAQGHA